MSIFVLENYGRYRYRETGSSSIGKYCIVDGIWFFIFWSENIASLVSDYLKSQILIVVLQGHKKLVSSNSDRYRLLVSDGLKTNSFTMLATQLNHFITDNVLSEYTVCEISKYALSTVNNSGKEK